MTDGLSTLYQDLLGGCYDCVDRIVLNAHFRMGHHPGGFRVWWRAVTGSDETLRLYERLGFRLVAGSAVPNRAGGVSLGSSTADDPRMRALEHRRGQSR
jgi:hypothetical protein